MIFLFALNSMKVEAQQNKDKAAVKISGLQMNVSGNIASNMKQIVEGIAKAAAEGSDFLVTPEGSLSGYTSNFDQNELTVALEKVRAEAVKMKVGLMLGTCYKEMVKEKEFCYNQVRVYSPEGQFIGEYSKVLRCSTLDMPGTGEMTEYVEGEPRVFEWRGTQVRHSYLQRSLGYTRLYYNAKSLPGMEA